VVEAVQEVAVVEEQEVAVVEEQEVAVEQEAAGLEAAAVASARGVAVAAQEQVVGEAVQEQEVAVVEEQEVAVAAQEQEPAEAVQELVVGEVAVGQAEDPAGELAAELEKGPRLEDGRLRRQCCAQPRADWVACQALLAHQEKAAVVVFRWRKRMSGRCWDCSRNWGSRAKIRMREWTRRLFNPA
jgi:hypothetical protein